MNLLGKLIYYAISPAMVFTMMRFLAFPMASSVMSILNLPTDHALEPDWANPYQIAFTALISFPIGYMAVYLSDYRNTCQNHVSGLIKSSGWDGEMR